MFTVPYIWLDIPECSAEKASLNEPRSERGMIKEGNRDDAEGRRVGTAGRDGAPEQHWTVCRCGHSHNYRMCEGRQPRVSRSHTSRLLSCHSCLQLCSARSDTPPTVKGHISCLGTHM